MLTLVHKLDFKTWQKWECDRLGISVDDHNKILEVSKNIAAAGLGWPYDYITSIIESPVKLAELAGSKPSVLSFDHKPDDIIAIG